MSTRSLPAVPFIALFMLILAAGAARDAAASEPLPLDIGATAITGQQGNTLVIVVSAEPGGQPLGRVCVEIDAQVFVLVPTDLTAIPAGGDPCGAPTAGVLFGPGDYVATAGVFEPGSVIPLKLIQVSGIRVAGQPKVDGARLSLDMTGDTDCDGDVDAEDGLNVLRRVANLGPIVDCVDELGNVKCDDGLNAVDALFIVRFLASAGGAVPQGCPPMLPAPTVLAPADGSIFTAFPRLFDVDWEAVPGADSYIVQVDCAGCCLGGSFCTDVGQGYRTFAGIEDTTYEASIGGDNLGRVRVWAVDSDGRPGVPSEWREFEFDTSGLARR